MHELYGSVSGTYESFFLLSDGYFHYYSSSEERYIPCGAINLKKKNRKT